MSSPDQAAPLAFLLTLRAYGTWLPGAAPGWNDRTQRGSHEPRPALERYARSIMRWPPVILDGAQRDTLRRALHELCAEREWTLLAEAYATEHLHVVVRADVAATRLRTAAKARLTTVLKRAGLFPRERQLWSDYGSVRSLHTEHAVAAACAYVDRHIPPRS